MSNQDSINNILYYINKRYDKHVIDYANVMMIDNLKLKK